NISKLVLPSQPFLQFGYRPQVEGETVFTRLLQVREEAKALGNDGAFAQFMVEFLAQSQSGETVGFAVRLKNPRKSGDGGAVRVRFMRVVHAAEEIENCSVGLDGVVSEAATVHLTQVEELQRVSHEIGGAKNKEFGMDVTVIAKAPLLETGDCARVGKVIGGVDRTCVQRDLVFESGVHSVEGEGQIFCLAVSTCNGESNVDSAIPSVHESGMQRLFICLLLRVFAYD